MQAPSAAAARSHRRRGRGYHQFPVGERCVLPVQVAGQIIKPSGIWPVATVPQPLFQLSTEPNWAARNNRRRFVEDPLHGVPRGPVQETDTHTAVPGSAPISWGARRALRSPASIASVRGPPCARRNAVTAARVLGPTSPSIAPGAKPLTASSCCTKRVSARRLRPKARPASASSAASNSASAAPVEAPPWDRWNAAVAARVRGPSFPSTGPGLHPRYSSSDWTSRRSGATRGVARAEEGSATWSSSAVGSNSSNAACKSL